MPDQPLIHRLFRHDRLITVAALGLVVTACAVFILAGGGTGMSVLGMAASTGPAGALLSGTPDMVEPMVWSLGHATTIFVMWWLMMVAMMLPSAAPTILLFGALNRSQGQWASLFFVSGYLAVWAAFSLIATTAQGALSAFGYISPMYMTLIAPWAGATVLILAGLYQLTPVKSACLRNCRGPVEALTHHRRTGRGAPFRMGLLHGRDCLGCCWALMALLFVGGVMNIWWILGLSLYVAIEKLAPKGQLVAQVLGVVLLIAGLALLIRGVPGL